MKQFVLNIEESRVGPEKTVIFNNKESNLQKI